MEKRTVLFIIISMAIIFAWDYMFSPRGPVPATMNPASSVVAKPATGASEPARSVAPVQPAQATVTVKEIETQLVKASVVKESGFFKRYQLKRYPVSITRKDPVDLFRDGLFDVYDSLYVGDQGVRIIYSEMQTSETDGTAVVTFKGTVNSIKVTKTVKLKKDAYVGDIRFDLQPEQGAPAQKISIATVFSQKYKESDHSNEGEPQPAFFAGKSYEIPSERQLTKGFKLEHATYGGLSEKYFALYLVDPAAKSQIDATLREGRADSIMTVFDGNVDPAKPVSIDLHYFAGAKDPALLQAYKFNLDRSIDYGFFHFIARPLLMIMNFFYSFTKNYGISIILLTFLIKLVFFPLSHKSYRSMKELQKLQPKMDELRKKYQDDREAMNKEMMQLYKKHGVNPLSGCLPMLVQIPFFIALYQALMYAIELRQAPFLGWIVDLSIRDPYYITPILMGATMLLQQVLTPSAGDPMQKKMMYILPVVFTFMFLNFPAGLVLYWLVNNVFSIAQQLYTMKKQEA